MADSLGGLLTNGLGGDCTAMILGPFRLKIFIEVTGDDGSAGGPGGVSMPLPAMDRDDEELKKKVIIMVKLGNSEIERTYIVSKNRSEKIIEIANIVNKTIENMKIYVSNFKKKVYNVKVRFTPKDSDD